jgi:hypothetical protein
VSREQELAADAHAVATCGPGPTASALGKVHRLGDLWGAYLQLDAIPAVNWGARVPILEGFRRFLAERQLRPEVTDHLAAARERPPSPGDTHPPVAQRLAAIPAAHAAAEPYALEQGASCLHLLGGEEGAERAFYERFTTEPLPPVRWDDLGREVLAPALTKTFAGGPLDPARTSLRELPRLVREAGALWDRSRGGVNILSPAARLRQGRRLLADWLVAALAARGFVPEVRPGAKLVSRRGEEEVAPAELVEALAAGEMSEAEVLEACERWDHAPGR